MAARRTSKPTQSSLDKILSRLPKTCVTEFREWCWHYPSYSDMSRRIDEMIDENSECFEGLILGEDYARNLGINACAIWHRREYPIGDEIKAFNLTLRSYQGVDYQNIPERLLVDAVKLICQSMTRLDDEQVAGVDSNTLIQTLPSLVREVRALMGQVDKARKLKNLHESRMQAVQIAVMAILNTFKDQNNEEAVKAAAIDAMIEVENWSRQNLD